MELKELFKYGFGLLITGLLSAFAFLLKNYFDTFEEKINSVKSTQAEQRKQAEEDKKLFLNRVDTISETLQEKISNIEKNLAKLDATASVSLENIKESIWEIKEMPKEKSKENFGRVTVKP